MAKNKMTQADIAVMKTKQNQQQKMIENYQKQRQWLTWAAGAIAILVLLLIGTMGYASNWWTTPEKTSSFTPSLTGSTTNDGGGSGGGGGGSSTNRSSDSRTTTTTNNTTTNTTTNNSSDTTKKTTLYDYLTSVEIGEDMSDVLDEARELGLGVDCRVDLLTVQVCDVSDGENTVTLKNLLSSEAITGITDNL